LFHRSVAAVLHEVLPNGAQLLRRVPAEVEAVVVDAAVVPHEVVLDGSPILQRIVVYAGVAVDGIILDGVVADVAVVDAAVVDAAVVDAAEVAAVGVVLYAVVPGGVLQLLELFLMELLLLELLLMHGLLLLEWLLLEILCSPFQQLECFPYPSRMFQLCQKDLMIGRFKMPHGVLIHLQSIIVIDSSQILLPRSLLRQWSLHLKFLPFNCFRSPVYACVPRF
jgi:hypothetical protein